MQSFKQLLEQPSASAETVRQVKIAFGYFLDEIEKLATEVDDKKVDALYKTANNKWWSEIRKVTDKHR